MITVAVSLTSGHVILCAQILKDNECNKLLYRTHNFRVMFIMLVKFYNSIDINVMCETMSLYSEIE